MKPRTVMIESAWEAGPQPDAAKLYARRALLDAMRKGEAPVSCVAMWAPLSKETRIPMALAHELAGQLDAWVFYVDTVDATMVAAFTAALRLWNMNAPQALRDGAIEFRAFRQRQEAEVLDPAVVLRTIPSLGIAMRNVHPGFARTWGVPDA